MRKVLDEYPGLACHYLLVGQGEVFTEPTLTQTVLGSCVSVTFFCRKTGVGGLFHALLPYKGEYESGNGVAEPYKYVDSAIERICARLEDRRVRLRDVECKVFGGAGTIFRDGSCIGEKNVRAAFETLAAMRLRVTASHVGGGRGRKIVFAAHTGEVYVKLLRGDPPGQGGQRIQRAGQERIPGKR